jgi:ABC-type sulfate/molybdate transport systems ATPase subunit
MIAGLEIPTSGEILIGGQIVLPVTAVLQWCFRAMRSILTSPFIKTSLSL